jgi:hypothetical protein
MNHLVALTVLLLSFLILTSSCTTIDFAAGGSAERIDWREYNDC